MTLTIERATDLLATRFAPWVQDLGLSFERVQTDQVVVRMGFSERLCREGGVICGQAFMALADTAAVFALFAAEGDFRACTTVDLAVQMMRPVSESDVFATAELLRHGRSMAFARVVLCADGDSRPAVHVSSTLALL